MTTPAAADFHQRLDGGILGSVRALHPAFAAGHGTQLRANHPVWQRLPDPTSLRNVPAAIATEINAKLDDAALCLAGDRSALLAVLFAPGAALDIANQTLQPGADIIDLWLRMYWLAEAAGRAVQAGITDPRAAPGDGALLAPLADRLCFLVFTEPFRHAPGGHWPAPEPLYGPGGLAGRALGQDTSHIVLSRCRQARRAWAHCIDEYESHLLLDNAPAAQFETELDLLTLRAPDRPLPTSGRALVLSWSALTSNAVPSNDDEAVAASVTTNHLLPRFKTWQVARLAWGATARDQTVGGSPPSGGVRRALLAVGRAVRDHRWAPAVVALAAAVAAITAFGLAAFGRFGWACWPAAICYLAILAGTVMFGRTWAAQWLLRLPAAGAVGLVVLLSLPHDWWSAPHVHWWTFAALLTASYGYLTVEARNHRVAAVAAAGRAVVVTLVGAGHALLVCILGLALVAPSYVEDGAALGGIFHGGEYGHAWSVLGLGAAWCLAVGVFSQILWDDRPITAPLAHLQWRRGR